MNPVALRDRLEVVRDRIAAAAERSGRRPDDVLLVAVTKTFAPEIIVEAARLGVSDFGENRVHEFRDKRASLDSAGVSARYHLIGHLQSNKARLGVELFDIIQSVDSIKLARILDRVAGETRRKLPVLVEVDFSRDPARPGFDPSELEDAVGELTCLEWLRPTGLMTVAPLELQGAGSRGVFRELRATRDRLVTSNRALELPHLSMGMSDDFETAIEEGATIVRLGRAIFGER